MARRRRVTAVFLIALAVVAFVVARRAHLAARYARPIGWVTAPTSEADDPAVQALCDGNLAFGLELAGKLAEGSDEDICISPLSLGRGLAMLSEGARGKTREQIRAVLHDTMPEAETAGTYALLAGFIEKARGSSVELRSADGIWVAPGVGLLPEYAAEVTDGYGARVTSAGFPKPAADDANRWVEKCTHRRIRQLVDPSELSHETPMLLLDVLYFDGPWARPFKRRDTQDAVFRSPDGEHPCKMMFRTGEMMSADCDVGGHHYQSVWLPYRGSDLAMQVILPEEGVIPFESEDWATEVIPVLTESMATRDVDLYLPRWTTTGNYSLREALRSLGLEDALDPSSADLSGLAAGSSPWLGEVAQGTWIRVNEAGTTAAAALLEALMKAKGASMKCDHPFAYLIRDTNTGAVLFLGRVMEPKE
jgi:serpin B